MPYAPRLFLSCSILICCALAVNSIDNRTKSYYNTIRTISYIGGLSVKRNHSEAVRRINRLTNELDSLYHQASLKMGISDSVSIVMYTVYEEGTECLLSDIYKKSGISKQTVNSAIRSLEADGILYLEQHTGRSKKVVLTDKGKAFAQKTAARLFQAEMDAFDAWTDDEVNVYIGLMEKYADNIRQQIEKM